jgi:hypothetical protein
MNFQKNIGNFSVTIHSGESTPVDSMRYIATHFLIEPSGRNFIAYQCFYVELFTQHLILLNPLSIFDCLTHTVLSALALTLTGTIAHYSNSSFVRVLGPSQHVRFTLQCSLFINCNNRNAITQMDIHVEVQ